MPKARPQTNPPLRLNQPMKPTKDSLVIEDIEKPWICYFYKRRVKKTTGNPPAPT